MTRWQRLASTLLHLVGTLLAVFVIFGVAYWVVEDYRLIDSLHWSMQTLSTTGYGDVPPKTDGGKILAMLLQPQALLLTALFFANFTKRAVHDPDAWTNEEQQEVLTWVREQRAKETNTIVRYN